MDVVVCVDAWSVVLFSVVGINNDAVVEVVLPAVVDGSIDDDDDDDDGGDVIVGVDICVVLDMGPRLPFSLPMTTALVLLVFTAAAADPLSLGGAMDDRSSTAFLNEAISRSRSVKRAISSACTLLAVRIP